MIYEMKLSVFAASSIIGAAIINRKLFVSDIGQKVILFWILVLPFAFILRHDLVNLLAFSAILYVINQKINSTIVTLVFFIGVLGAVPDWSAYIVSLPGINYLIRLSFDKVATITLLLPLFFLMHKNSRVKWSLTDTLVCAFVFYMVMLTFREGKVTTVLRFLVDSFIIYIVPYFVFTRYVRSLRDLHYCALGFLILSVLLAAVFFISQIVKIDIYSILNPYSTFQFIGEYRAGFLRLSGPFNGVLVGFVMLSGYLSFGMLRKYDILAHVPVWVFLSICVLCVFFGGSRGALFGFVLGVGIYFYFVKFTGVTRILSVCVMAILLVLEFSFDISSLLSYEDEYGTFDYRSEMYQASWSYLQNNFWGSPYYLRSGYFDHLVTGLGIIDIVSAYLQISLQYGFVGVGLFIGIYLSVIIPLFKQSLSSRQMNIEIKEYSAMYLSLNVVMMFIISTTSLNSLFPLMIMLNLAIGRVLISPEINT